MVNKMKFKEKIILQEFISAFRIEKWKKALINNGWNVFESNFERKFEC